MKNKWWIPYLISSLLGVVLFAPIVHLPIGEYNTLRAQYAGAYDWLMIPAGFLCAFMFPKQYIVLYPVCMVLAPAILFSFVSHSSGAVVALLLLSFLFSSVGVVAAWLMRLLLNKLNKEENET